LPDRRICRANGSDEIVVYRSCGLDAGCGLKHYDTVALPDVRVAIARRPTPLGDHQEMIGLTEQELETIRGIIEQDRSDYRQHFV
jgi:hypothetical protein